jgi:hypothetical protein
MVVKVEVSGRTCRPSSGMTISVVTPATIVTTMPRTRIRAWIRSFTLALRLEKTRHLTVPATA